MDTKLLEYYTSSMSMDEIARRLGVTKKAVYSRIYKVHRAVEKSIIGDTQDGSSPK